MKMRPSPPPCPGLGRTTAAAIIALLAVRIYTAWLSHPGPRWLLLAVVGVSADTDGRCSSHGASPINRVLGYVVAAVITLAWSCRWCS